MVASLRHSMPVKVYKLDMSPPARAVMMACDIFNVPAEMIDLDFTKREHLTPEYLEKNPLHTIPGVEDGDLFIHDSNAAVQYLADAYGKDDSWYPKDLKKRTLVNQKLFFNNSILFPRIRNITESFFRDGETMIPRKKLDAIKEAYHFLEAFLSKSKYLAADHITIADVAAISSVTTLVVLIPLDEQKYPKLAAWIKEMEKQPFAKKYNEPGKQICIKFVENFEKECD